MDVYITRTTNNASHFLDENMDSKELEFLFYVLEKKLWMFDKMIPASVFLLSLIILIFQAFLVPLLVTCRPAMRQTLPRPAGPSLSGVSSTPG